MNNKQTIIMEKKLTRTYAKHIFSWEYSTVAKIQEDLDALKAEGIEKVEIEVGHEWDEYIVTFKAYTIREETDEEFNKRTLKEDSKKETKIKEELELLAKLEEKYYGKQR